MFFYFAKIFGFLAIASNAVIVLGLAGIFLLRFSRFRKAGSRIAVTALIMLAVMGFSPLGTLMILPLENRFPVPELQAGTQVDGIIVLGGAVDTHVSTFRGQPGLTDAAERMTVAVQLAQRFPGAKLVFTGGTAMIGGAFWNEMTEAEVAARFFRDSGLPPERLVFENRSRDTYENARFTHELLKPRPGQRFLLVTSAYHMPRSVGLFRKSGFEVLAYPVDFRTAGTQDMLRPFYALSDGLRQCNIASREWIGLLFYRLSGRTDTLFPQP